MKKAYCLLLISAILFGLLSGFMVSADGDLGLNARVLETGADSAAESELRNIGVFNGYPDGFTSSGMALTRAELAILILRLVRIEPDDFTEQTFIDVPADHWAVREIGTVYNKKILNGYGAEVFGPYDFVTYGQALKAILHALDYESTAQRKGGYPWGYLILAKEKGLAKDLNLSDDTPINRGEMARLMHNALYISKPDDTMLASLFGLSIAGIKGDGIDKSVYYVSPNGRDDNPGTERKPWKTFNKAAYSADAGSTVIFEDGEYYEDRAVSFKNSGAEKLPIIFKARNPHQAKVIFGADTRLLPKVNITSKSSHITLQGFEFTQEDTATEDDATKTKDIIIDCRGDYCSFIGNKIYNCFEDGIKSTKNIGTLIEDNIIYAVEHEGLDIFNCDRAIIRGNSIGEVGRCGIMLKGGTRNSIVYNNHIHNKVKVLGAGFHIGGISNNIDPFDTKVGTGSELYNCIVYNNIVEAKSVNKITVGMYFISSSDGHCYNNLIIGAKSAFGFYLNSGSWGWQPPVKNPVIKNNIVYKCGEAFLFRVEPINMQSDYNLYFETGRVPIEANSIKADPLFVNEASDFRLMLSSPAVGRGLKLPSSFPAFDGEALEIEWLDYSGKARTEPWDLGVYNIE